VIRNVYGVGGNQSLLKSLKGQSQQVYSHVKRALLGSTCVAVDGAVRRRSEYDGGQN
jgi:hypothetical protein